MKVAVLLFAGARQSAGAERVVVDLAEGANLGELRTALATQCPQIEALVPHAMFAVDAAYATDDFVLTNHTEVACIPPVSGG